MTSRRAVLGLYGIVALLALHPARAADLDVWGVLRQGGVVLFRHANAPGVGDPPGFDLDDCSTQQNLGAAGRLQAAAIGARLRAERVAVGAVLSSQWCRARDTAELAFPGLVRTEPAFNSFFDAPERRASATAEARAIISAWRGPGVLVVVTHQVNITGLTGIVPADGEGVVLRPPANMSDIVGRVKP